MNVGKTFIFNNLPEVLVVDMLERMDNKGGLLTVVGNG